MSLVLAYVQHRERVHLVIGQAEDLGLALYLQPLAGLAEDAENAWRETLGQANTVLEHLFANAPVVATPVLFECVQVIPDTV